MTVPTSAAGLPVDMVSSDVTYGRGDRVLVSLSLPLLSLSDFEAAMVARMSSAVTSQRYVMELHNAYYEGNFRVADLGISIPPQMRNVRTVLGWCRVAIDALDARLNLQGFRYPDSNDVDAELMDMWSANRMDSESQMAHIDAMVFGHSVISVGSNPDDPELPLIQVESPLDFAIEWDARTRQMVAALRLVGLDSATLYLPNETVVLEKDSAISGWVVVDRDQHNLGTVLVERITNRPRTYNRNGASEITPELMSTTDAACRTLMGLQVAQEFYQAPQRYILGADEAAFMSADGTPKSGWETYMGRVLALERDADGNVPTVGQFTPYDPATFTKVIDMYAKHISSITSLPPHVLGYTTDNPASADAIRSAENGLVTKANRKTVMFGGDWSNVMAKALLVRGGTLPPNAHRIAGVWGDTATPTIGATTDAITKQIAAGYLPATSDVVGEKLGYSAVERARIEVDRMTDAGSAFLQEIAHSIGAKAARIDKSLTADIGIPDANPTDVPAVASGNPVGG